MIVLAYDHRGYELFKKIKNFLKKNKIEFVEFASPEYDGKDNYAKFSIEACKYILENKDSKGIFCCGTGIGISISANRHKGIRAGICNDIKTTYLARNDDDINVLVLAGNTTKPRTAYQIIKTYLNTSFEGGRHLERLSLLDK